MGAKISSVTVTITETDIMSNIREFVKVEGLTINNVEFKDKSIEITGNYQKVINIPFLMRIRVDDVTSNKIRIVIEKIKVLKIGLPNVLLLGAARALKGKLEPLGVTVNGNEIIVDADKLMQKVDHVHMIVEHIIMENGVLAVKIKAISADVEAMKKEKQEKEEYEASGQKEIDEEIALQKVMAERIEYNRLISSMDKDKDEYSRIRDRVKGKVPGQYNYIFEYAAAIPDIFALSVRLIKDKRILLKDKVILGATMGYFLSPIDILPDSIPFLGKMDDLALLTFGVNHMLNRIPMPLVVEHWSGEIETLTVLKDNIDRLLTMFGSKNINKLYNIIEKPLGDKFGRYMKDEYYFKNGYTATMNPNVIKEEEDLIITPGV